MVRTSEFTMLNANYDHVSLHKCSSKHSIQLEKYSVLRDNIVEFSNYYRSVQWSNFKILFFLIQFISCNVCKIIYFIKLSICSTYLFL